MAPPRTPRRTPGPPLCIEHGNRRQPHFGDSRFRVQAHRHRRTGGGKRFRRASVVGVGQDDPGGGERPSVSSASASSASGIGSTKKSLPSFDGHGAGVEIDLAGGIVGLPDRRDRRRGQRIREPRAWMRENPCPPLEMQARRRLNIMAVLWTSLSLREVLPCPRRPRPAGSGDRGPPAALQNLRGLRLNRGPGGSWFARIVRATVSTPAGRRSSTRRKPARQPRADRGDGRGFTLIGSRRKRS